jgi:RimJ/RimL family protein N-acetyltransferase
LSSDDFTALCHARPARLATEPKGSADRDSPGDRVQYALMAGQPQRPMRFSPMPLRLETERLILTPEEPSDAEWFTELLNTRGTGTFTVADARKRIDVMTDTIESTGIGALVLRRRPDGEALGYTAIVVGRGSLAEPELAYELLPPARGHGYATEAARALLAAAFDTGRRRMWATIGSWNTPSLRVAEKLGFRRDHCTTDVDGDGEVVWMVCDR